MKIGIVGVGQVGATAAYAMMMRGVGSEIVLVDRNADLAVAQARDVLDAAALADPLRVRAGELANLDGARVVVLAAGASQRPGESRLDLLVAQCRNLRGDRAGGGGGGSRSHLSCGDQSARRHDPDCDCPRRPERGGAASRNRVRYDPRTPRGSARCSRRISESTRRTSMPVCSANMATVRFCTGRAPWPAI